MNIEPILAAASRHGLVIRGGFNVEQDDQVPAIGPQVAAGSMLLFGNAGSSIWASFSRSDEYRDGRSDPLNRWSERIANALGSEFGGQACFPFGEPPYQPFLRWAKKAESLQNSRLGMLIHPQYGLWHAYRFALTFPLQIESVETISIGSTRSNHRGICHQCEHQPCVRTSPANESPANESPMSASAVNACPVNAFATGYDVQSCFRYLEANPESKCMTTGCQARIACPQGVGYRYQPRHAVFHMRAFVSAMAEKDNL